MENENSEIRKTMENIDNKLLVPGAIILASLLVAGAIVYVGPQKSPAAVVEPALKAAEERPNAPSPNAADILKIKAGDFVLGNPSSKVVIIEYGDFQCPFCERFFSDAEFQIKEQYIKTGKAAFIFRDFAFLGEESFKAAEAARCSAEQGKFWEYHDKLYSSQKGENKGAFADANLKKWARELGLDGGRFDTCFSSGKYRKAIEDAVAGGRAVGVSGTPATFVNGKLVSGAVPFATFKKLIDEELNK